MKAKYPTVNVLGVNFTKITNHALRTQLIADSQQHLNRFVVTANPEIVLYARHDPAYARVIQQADYITADGIGIIKGAQLLHTPLPERVTGFDTLVALLAFAAQNNKRVFLLGAKSAVLELTVAHLHAQYPHLKIVGYHDGYFDDAAQVAAEITASAPDFVFVALGFPKQEFFIAKYRSCASAIWMGVGGSFDVLAGTVKRAPLFWQKHHIEWLYRLLQEPTRIGRILSLPRYLALVLFSKYNHQKK
ncbi:WecB/TagA/CpsF family glycosyltransferase [Liquorilactobacillus satsumensis]|uniref:N-acetylglucosaminyldiphosphoundecaprenol N-acetyl-beta-D-mannosaminyltransferase n=1 Tax=Liquorilactobacillus satsumensis DSM 16230 = JCM 12392 TaxID=1423801 RepID=A0A0R1V3X8_9LACO|nr:WecB/TagA/CpsF family glycosyltransferase [Liquorilactobacillus satsumensis]KRM00269.1 N-acetylglucosaminyldiphosphoundecaprenol N-acetyl-beta-D-mannosaminyltransferase [Liquorilactobacillus satsumensis DSM 16230 = JCM 12392]MCC7665830.1 glycosyltransferase [Liquorilactobacillus satsumensis]MCP9313325.1 WecB/TagA/CpsF family glycosyltransferase [Liquorilactobacillus satsumensis]MCP9328156.1 WecB/TagA/CpsF family glycosyltransferase [Liquorilactobacillus satsumensis]MCP9356375.1 WecB/TagA/Cp